MPSDAVARRLSDILDNIGRIRRYLAGRDLAAFSADDMCCDAVERCLERIAAAARKIGDQLDGRYPQADLHKLRQFGSVLRHDYDMVKLDRIWAAATGRLDTLEAMCRAELGEYRATQ